MNSDVIMALKSFDLVVVSNMGGSCRYQNVQIDVFETLDPLGNENIF